MDETQKWHAWVVFESGAELAALRADLRTKGLADADFVFVVADASDRAIRYFAEWLDPSFPPVDQGFVSAVPTADAVRALSLLSGTVAAASLGSQPRPAGTIRVLVVARGRASFCDIGPDLPPSGVNALGGGVPS